MEVSKIIRKHAIQNRVQHGKADAKSVMGKVLGEFPDARKDIKKTLLEIERIVNEVNLLPEDQITDTDFKKEKKKREHILRLPGDPKNIVMRFAPNPNGPATLGSARGMVVNSQIAREYKGEFILRFDDTDPKNKKPMPKAYEWYLDDCTWLNAKPDRVYYASDRIHTYYQHAEKLIGMGHAYVCFCDRQTFKGLRDSKTACPHRDSTPEDNLALWQDMLKGKFKEGECVLRIKTDICHKDPARRDWVAFRIVEDEHPRVGKKYRVWPMLDFESGIEDHLLGVTHIIRGKDLIDSEHRQRYMYGYLSWEYPKTMHWGRVKIEEFGKFSTSMLRQSIEAGEYSGWDDPRLPTIRAIRRRGITPQALRNLMVSLGLNDVDVSISLENLFAENRKVLDPIANRYYFVGDPVSLTVENAPEKDIEVFRHPTFKERGKRNLSFRENTPVFISEKDAKSIKTGDEIRLMNLFNVRITCTAPGNLKAEYVEGKNFKVPKIQWLQEKIDAEVICPNEIIQGFCEKTGEEIEIGEHIQFERFGFAILDRIEGNKHIFYFSHR